MILKGLVLFVTSCVTLVECGVMERNMEPPKIRRQARTQSHSPQTRFTGCEYQGQHYFAGQSFGEGYDPSSNWCYGAFCSESGDVIYWDNFECKSTTPTPTTLPPTTPAGCWHNGQVYPPQSVIDSGYDESSNWCYGSYCDQSGQVIAWDNFNCKTTPTTIPPTTTTPTLPPSTPSGQTSRTSTSDSEKLQDFLRKLKAYFGLRHA